MNHFHVKQGALWCEGVPLERIAQQVGTPTYVYSRATLERHFTVLTEALAGLRHLVCYSVKANSTLGVLRLFATLGSSFDIVSGGELARVLQAGGDPKKVVFAGVGKTEAEMVAALRAKILLFNVESAEELETLERVARRLKVKAPFAIRVNPDVDPRTHRYIATGLKTSKFGIPVDQARALYLKSRASKGLVAKGLDCHIGSQLTDARPMRQAARTVATLYRELRGHGLPLTHLDIGGGLGIVYKNETPPSVNDYAQVLVEELSGLDTTVVLEPGRMLVGNAGLLLTTVLYRKQSPAKRFVVVDAGMNDLMRPALYEAWHEIEPVRPRKGKKQVADVVGPVCESTDVLGHARELPPLAQGDLVAVRTAGAYGMSMANNYNSRPKPAEVLVDGSRAKVIRARERTSDLWRGEV